MDWEPDLENAWKIIKMADHMVWIHPVWWEGYPAIMKGFIDRVFLPVITFQHKKNSSLRDKYLQGKSAHNISTLDQPWWYYRLVYGRPSINQPKNQSLNSVEFILLKKLL